jgi:hypothetical protein
MEKIFTVTSDGIVADAIEPIVGKEYPLFIFIGFVCG